MTKKQRNKIYKKMIEEFCDNLEDHELISYFGLCTTFMLVTGKLFDAESLPEIIKHKPEKCEVDDLWWNLTKYGTDKRICVLLEAIMETL